MTIRTLIKNAAYILTMDPALGELRNADLLIEGTTIAAIGHSLIVSDAEVVDASRMIVLPGFVDTHRHTWQSLARNIASDWSLAQYFGGIRAVLSANYLADDMYLGNLLEALEALDCGITTLCDWSHNNNSPQHADAAIAGLRDAGIRALYNYGNSAREWYPVSDRPTNFDDLRRVQKQYFSSRDQLLTLGFAARGIQFATLEQTLRDFREARALGLPISVHVGDGLWGMNGPLLAMAQHDLLSGDTTYVHCNTLQDSEFRLIGETGGKASIAPEVEQHMGHGPLATLKLIKAGVSPTISIDVTTSIGGDMFSAMRALMMGTRAAANSEALARQEVLDPLPLSCLQVLEFATRAGAHANGLDHTVGSIAVGKAADLVMIDTNALNLFPINNAANAVVEAAHPGNVDSVFVAGRPIKRGGALLGVDLGKLRARVESARDKLLARSGVSDSERWAPAPYRGH